LAQLARSGFAGLPLVSVQRRSANGWWCARSCIGDRLLVAGGRERGQGAGGEDQDQDDRELGADRGGEGVRDAVRLEREKERAERGDSKREPGLLKGDQRPAAE
jgi:hypothetical protein